MIAKLMELTNMLFRYRGTAVAGAAGVGRGDPPAAADAGAGRAAHQRGAVEPPPGRGRRGVVVDPRPARGPRSTRRSIVEATREIPIQVNGKLRDKVTVPTDASEAEIEPAVLARDKIVGDPGRQARRDRVVVAGGGKLVNIVVR